MTNEATDPTPAGKRIRWLPHPGSIRLWHFIALPTIGMGLLILVGRLVGALIEENFGAVGIDLFDALRPIIITVAMASLVAALALGYRRQYEVELQRQNKKLEETRDFLYSIIEGSGEAIVRLDPAGRVSSWNRSAERIFGWTADEMIGKTFRRLLPDDPSIIEERNRVGRLVRDGRTVRDFQTTRLHRCGSKITVRITWSPVYTPLGEFDGVVGIVLDVTSETEIKRRLVEQERLAAVGEMAAQMAHEVRNPLAGIRGACEMIFRKNTLPETREEVGHEVVQQIDRLNRTVDELLQFAKPRSLQRREVDLNELIDRVASVMGEDPRTRTVTLVRDLGEDIPSMLLDPEKLEQVIYNLFLNASQMMDFEGTIVVSTGLEEDRVRVSIRDTGPGISAKLGPDIFKPFVTSRTRGTGLGLAIVKKLIEAHDGTIEASNHEDGGAVFEICLDLPPGGSRNGD